MIARKYGLLTAFIILVKLVHANPVEHDPTDHRLVEHQSEGVAHIYSRTNPGAHDVDDWPDHDDPNLDDIIGFEKAAPLEGAGPPPRLPPSPPKSPKSPPKSPPKDSKRELEKRAPRINAELYKTKQLDLLLKICEEIKKVLTPKTFVLFVGNSGSYMKYCFNHPRMGAIPISKARKYEGLKDPEADPRKHGKLPGNDWDVKGAVLAEYYERYLSSKFRQIVDKKNKNGNVPDGMEIDRFLLVDHSSTGKSVDATREILSDCIHYAAMYNTAKKTKFPELIKHNQYENAEWELFNVIDKSKTKKNNMFSSRVVDETKVINPENVKVVKHFWVGDEGDVNRLLGDEGHHYRNQLDYWPARWGTSVADLWQEDDNAKNLKKQAYDIREQIRSHVIKEKKGKLITPKPERLAPN